jgi:putative membrane protein
VTRRRTRLLALVAAILAPRAAQAHAGRALEPHDLWLAWTFAPAVWIGLAAAAYLYASGLAVLWRRAGRGRVVAPWRARCFWAGIAALVVALISPVDAVGSALFAVHMVQHLLLIMIAAPLLVLGDALTATLWALPLRWRRRVGSGWRRARTVRALWSVLRAAPVAWALHVVALWIWHAPPFYEAALRNEAVHVLEHATFFLTALLFWWVLLVPHGRPMGTGARVLYLFTAGLQSTILGAMITFARHPWYPAHFGTTQAWGLTPLEDQQLAGLLMWIPAGLVYLVALLPLLGSALTADAPSQGVVPSTAGVSARGTP